MRLITADFETYYDREYSLTKLSTEAYVRDSRFEVIGVSIKVDDQAPAWFSGTHDQVKTWLEQFDIPNSFLLAHNTMFDGFVLSHHFGITAKFYLDTLSMSRPKHQMTVGGSLKALSDYYTVGVKGDEVVKAIGMHRVDFTPAELAAYAAYCMKDTQLCYMLFQIMKKDLPKDEFRVIDLFIRMFVEPVLQLNQTVLAQHLENVKAAREEALEKVKELAGEDVLMSNKKFAELLVSLGVDPPTKISHTTGKSTFAFSKTDEEFRELLDHADPRVQAVVGARLGVKSSIEESRTTALMGVGSRGLLPVPLSYYAAHTGRAGGTDKINLQNLTRGGELRRAIEAPEDCCLVVGDSSSIEARMVAWLAGQLDLVAAFADGSDIYTTFASDLYGRPIPPKEKTTERQVGKVCILGLGYGMGAKKLQHFLRQVGVVADLDFCKNAVYLYRGKYKRITQLWNVGERALLSIVKGEEFSFGPGGLLRTSSDGIHLPNGMIIRYPGLTLWAGEFAYASDRREQAEWTKQKLSGKWDFNLLTRIYGGKVIENVVQALARIVVFDQMVRISKLFRVVLTVHDEIVACVHKSQTQEAVAFFESMMRKAADWATGLPISAEVGSAAAYGDAK